MSACCVVCSRVGFAQSMPLLGGTVIGPACPDACSILCWELHFVRSTGGTRDEIAEVQWRWRRHVAGIDGRPFTEPAPVSEAEKAFNRKLAVMGLAS